MRRGLTLLILVFCAYTTYLTAQEKPAQAPAPLLPSISCTELPEVAPGESVAISCDNLPTHDAHAYIKNVGDQTTGKGTSVRTEVDGKTLKFQVPDNTPSGQYSVSLAVDSKEPSPIPGQLNVLGPVVVDAIYPLTNYPAGKGFDFAIAGKNFTKLAQIEVIGQGPVPSCPADATGSSGVLCRKDIQFIDTAKLKVTGFYPGRHYGPIQLSVHVGNSFSKPVSVVFAAATQQGVAFAAAIVFVVLAFVLYRLIQKGVGGSTINGEKFGPLTSIFLDRQTNSYSLSKFQVLAWTAVTVYSYIYLFLCRTLIQGDFTFPDVSQNLPQLFFVSAGTTVAAAAITANWGSKGGGPIRPSMADFISTGGLVAGDRFQFFIWTLVGCAGYLYLVVGNNPEILRNLPDIPQNFLYLMGVSSAGYLGGKLVRKPGPVVKVLSVAKVTPIPPGGLPADPAAAAARGRELLDQQFRPQNADIKVALPVLTLNLKGENLDPKGNVKADGQPLRGDAFWINGMPDPQSGFCTELNVSLNDAAKYIDGTHELMLVNSDGQGASVGFPADPMTMDPIPDQPARNAAADVEVIGKNLAPGTTAEWRNPADALQAANATVTFVSPTKLTVNFVSGQAGTGKLTLISPIGLRASVNVTVR